MKQHRGQPVTLLTSNCRAGREALAKDDRRPRYLTKHAQEGDGKAQGKSRLVIRKEDH